MTLYELSAEYMNLLSLLNDEEVDGDSLTAYLDNIEGEFEEKAENYAIVMQSMANDIESIEKEIKRLRERKEALDRNKQSLKNYLEYSMKTIGKTKFKTARFSFNIAKNGGSLPVILKVDAEHLPDELRTVVYKANNKAILDYIASTGDETYAEIGERGESLRIR